MKPEFKNAERNYVRECIQATFQGLVILYLVVYSFHTVIEQGYFTRLINHGIAWYQEQQQWIESNPKQSDYIEMKGELAKNKLYKEK